MSNTVEMRERIREASALTSKGLFIEALPFWKRAVDLSRKFASRETLHFCLRNLAESLSKVSQHEEALGCWLQVIELSTTQESRTYSHLHAGRTLKKLDRTREAITMLQHALEHFTLWRGSDGHIVEADIHTNLGLCYHNIGSQSEALEHCRKAVEISDQLVSSDENYQFRVQWLAECLTTLGEHREALACWQRLQRHCEAQFGRNHLSTVQAKLSVVQCLYTLKEHELARSVAVETLEDAETLSRTDNKVVLFHRHKLAKLLLKVRRFDEAVPVFQQVVTDSERILGSDHPGTLAALNGLANSLEKLDRLDEALSIWQKIGAASQACDALRVRYQPTCDSKVRALSTRMRREAR